MELNEIDEIRNASAKDLKEKINEIGMGIFTIKSKSAMEKSIAKNNIIKKMKKNRARMMTVLRERLKSEGKE